MLLPEIISKEPLGLMVRKGDDKFFDVVRWTFFALLQAEESGVTQTNVDQMAKTRPTRTSAACSGVEGDLGKALGLDNKWAVNVIKAVGNFGEIWERDITPLGIPRGHQQSVEQGRPAIPAADPLSRMRLGSGRPVSRRRLFDRAGSRCMR